MSTGFRPQSCVLGALFLTTKCSLLQTLTVFATRTGGPCDLCVAHGRLHCLCAADVEEACLFWEDDGTEASFAELGGEEEMHVLCSFAFVGREKHY